MARFVGILPGQQRNAPGLRVEVRDDGQNVYMAGKWLGLAEHHLVLWLDPASTAVFVRPDGQRRLLGSFPAWVVRGIGKRPAKALMTDAEQFVGGGIEVRSGGGAVVAHPVR